MIVGAESHNVRIGELLEQAGWARSLARSLVADASTADDLVQETWLAALRNPPRDDRNLKGWIGHVVRNFARRRHRDEELREDHQQRQEAGEADPAPASLVAAVETQRLLSSLVLSLSEPYRTTVLLRYYQGLSSIEIARRQGVAASTVRGRLRRALAELREQLDERSDGDRQAWLPGLAILAWPSGSKTWTVSGLPAVLEGVVLMGIQTKIVCAVLGLATVGVLGLWYSGMLGPTPRETPQPTPPTLGERELPELEPVVATELPTPPASRRENRSVATVSPTEAVYVLHDPEDLILTDAFVALATREELLRSGETDERGEFTYDQPETGVAELLVVAPGWVPQILEVPLEGGRHLLRLERGSVVSGQVLVSGETPSERILLELCCVMGSRRSFRSSAAFRWSQLGLPADSSHKVRAWTDEFGSFRIQGLAANWRGELRLPVEYRLEDPTLAARDRALNTLALETPEENLVLRVVRRLTIVGRAIEYTDGQAAPVSGALVRQDLRVPRAFMRAYTNDYIKWDETDEEGRFTLVVPARTILGGEIRIESPDRRLSRELEIEPAEFESELDLGDIVLGGGREALSLSLRVVDEELLPVEGAVAAIEVSSPASQPTDERGKTILGHVVPGETVFSVYALGYEAADIAVPVKLTEELEVVLRRGALLDLRFLKPDGEVARDVRARFAATEHPYRNELLRATRKSYTQTECSFFEAFHREDGLVVARLSAGGDGRVVLNDLEPGLPLQLRIEGRFAGVIQEEAIPPLRPGEHRVQEIVLRRPPATLSGRVLDEAGAPLSSMVYVGIAYSHSELPPMHSNAVSGNVKANGEFEFKNIYSTTVMFSASADGYVIHFAEVEIPEEGAFIEVRLSPANLAVTVTVEDENGKRQRATSVRAFLADGTIACVAHQLEDEEGVYLLRGLPDEEVTITAYAHSVPYTISHDPNDPELLITVPALGGMRATVHLLDESRADDSWLLCLVPTSESAAVTQYAPLYDTVITDVLPGPYYVVLRHFPSGWEHLDDFVETSLRVPIEVSAGIEEKVELWEQP